MKDAADSTPPSNILSDDSDLGPEPDWLTDLDEPVAPKNAPTQSHTERIAQSTPVKTEVTTEVPEVRTPESPQPFRGSPAPLPLGSHSTAESVVVKKDHPWLWGVVPLVLLLATAIIAWFGATQTLNDLATWDAIREQSPGLLPARWAMLIWWLVIPLMAVFLVYAAIPAGRQVTRIKITAPLISLALVATGLWVFAQHWHWEVVGIISAASAALAMLITYLVVSLGPHITSIRQRMIAMIPLSAALGYSVMLTVIAWQSYSDQPFGERGSSVLFAVLLVMIAAVFSFFLRDGLFSLVLAIWFAGVVYQQWGEDAVISLVGAVTVLLTGALAGLGTILATESHRPSLTTSVETKRGRTSFFRRNQNSPQDELP